MLFLASEICGIFIFLAWIFWAAEFKSGVEIFDFRKLKVDQFLNFVVLNPPNLKILSQIQIQWWKKCKITSWKKYNVSLDLV